MSKMLWVILTVSAEKEQEFTEWYEGEYIPRLLKDVPELKDAARYKGIDGNDHTYITIYQMDENADIEAVKQAITAPEREDHRKVWKKYAAEFLTDVSDGFFIKTFSSNV